MCTCAGEATTQVKRRRRSTRSAGLATAVVTLGAAVLVPSISEAQAQEPVESRAHPQAEPPRAVKHDLDGPFDAKRDALKQKALQRLAKGERPLSRNGSQVMKVDDRYVELSRTQQVDKIFTILVEFGDEVDEEYGGDPGPRHNEIPEPDREQNNSTEWQEDYDRQHYQELYFGEDPDKPSMKQYFEQQSSGRYSVDGTVSDWVRVDYNEARYGTNKCGETTCKEVWDVVAHGVNKWVEAQRAAGKTDEEIKRLLAEYDQWDRYDYDGDGDFNEPDGYIDHFQIVHAGEDESAGGGAQGEDAIWAHRWYAFGTDAGRTGPENNKAGGAQIGETGVWVGDYTIQPENGGLGVFAHEYAHDLGLPDLYDTSGEGESSVAFWSLMASGSWLGRGEDAIGDLPNDMSGWDKFQLGWLDYDTAQAATRSEHTLGPLSLTYPEGKAGETKQGVVVELPEKTVTTELVEPAAGEKQWWSGMGDDLSNTLTRSVDLTGATTASLDLQGWWEIEAGYDFLYTEVSTDGGANWTALDGTANGEPISRDGSDTPALDGTSDGYVDLSYPLDDYAGKRIELRFRYETDGGAAEKGFAADEIVISADGEPILTDGAEEGEGDWTAEGFEIQGASFTKDYPQFYVIENRQYVAYDQTLRTGPYHFGWATERPEWVEHYPYDDGLLVWLWDTSQLDNNVGEHPGTGLILPVDANPAAEKWADGSLMRNRVQAHDSTFSRYPSKGFTLHNEGEAVKVKGKKPQPFFDDHTGTYYDEENPTGGVKVPDTNTRVTIVSESRDGEKMTIRVSPSES